MAATIHELTNPLCVHTPHGEGKVLFIIDYSVDVNTVWVVRLGGGFVKHYFSADIRVYGNPAEGQGYDIDIPKDWKQ